MRFTVLGCGTSTGVPVPACNCAVCTSNDPKNTRTRTAGLVTLDDGRNLIIDTGPDFRAQILREGVKQVDAVLYTHSHADHILGMEDLRGFNFILKRPVDCYATKDTTLAIQKLFHYIFNPPANYTGGMLTQVNFNEIRVNQPFTVLGLEVTPFLLYHGEIPVTGFKIGSLAYATDCKVVPDESKEIIRSCKTLVLDGLRFRQHSTHLTIDESIQLVQELDIDMCYLTHMSHDVDYYEASKKLPDNIEFAYDGLNFDI